MDDTKTCQTGPERPTLHCSFCHKSQWEIRKLIAGPSKVYICDECVSLCNEIFALEKLEHLKGEPGKLGKYIAEQTDLIADIRDRIREAAQAMGAALVPENDTRH